MTTLAAGSITAFQQCPRKWLLNQSGETRRWRPRSIFIRQLRAAIHSLSSGSGKLEDVTAEAVAGLLEVAANPGLDTPRPFETARSLCSILRTVLARVDASKPPSCKPLPGIMVGEKHVWKCQALSDGRQLHHWTAVDSLSDAILSRELHSWYVVGDCAAAALPMTVHVVEIGRQAASGRFNSPWCRCWSHPHVMNRWAFQQKDGKLLQGKWKPIYFEDGRNDAQTWIELMDRDNVQALKDVAVKQLRVEQARQVLGEMVVEANRMEEIKSMKWVDVPMRRTACDLPVCGWQSLCFR